MLKSVQAEAHDDEGKTQHEPAVMENVFDKGWDHCGGNVVFLATDNTDVHG